MGVSGRVCEGLASLKLTRRQLVCVELASVHVGRGGELGDPHILRCRRYKVDPKVAHGYTASAQAKWTTWNLRFLFDHRRKSVSEVHLVRSVRGTDSGFVKHARNGGADAMRELLARYRISVVFYLNVRASRLAPGPLGATSERVSSCPNNN